MANTVASVKTAGGLHMYLVDCASSGTTETVQLPPGKTLVACTYPVFTSATPRTAVTFAYVRATGVLTVGALTSSDAFTMAVITD